MWVRSQDKTKLINTDRVEITGSVIRCCNGDYSISIGQYSTEEKALKVLDLLEKYKGGKEKRYIVEDTANINIAYEVLNNIYIPMDYCKNGIFHMPQDEEV